ncbi:MULTISPECIES: PadR family transcriptional regulator [unclassified Leifsonia]|uniref:PadR family transcriptional regulator n=1 Tax=unclassified Leifsonia TaxID=2663824 RepID=UPI0006F23565|nr:MULTISPECIES: PadR family transcriptional regulator [unclassified Leifsonia]KQX07275.1 transcriptional regulator [Leifsonia sp. Root1293]KRA11558.1 transcriptional regulator [Leifsonia sp. Root60]
MAELTPLGIAALALLAERPMHPYEMYQTLVHRREDRNVKVRPGSLYHAVDRLARAGLVDAVGVDREGNRPERTSYAITDAGRHALDDRVAAMLATPAEEYPEFRHAVAQAHNLPVDEVLALLRSRRTALHDDLDALGLATASIDSKRIPERFWLDVHYQSTMLRAELEWLDTTIERIANGQISWTEAIPHNLTEKNH